MTVDDAVARALTRRNAPLSVAIGGHGRTGRSTLAAAIRARFRLPTVVVDDNSPPPDGIDLTIRVIGAQPRRCDVDALASSGRMIVVAGKADLRDDPQSLAEMAAERLGMTVHPVSGLLASVTVGPGDVALLRSDPVAPDVLRRFGVEGVARARELGAVTAEDLAARLRELSGIDAVGAAIRSMSPAIAAGRDLRMRADLRLAAARAIDRDLVETALAGVMP
ncbi:hypothetical protein JVX90_19725 [Gordonia sp. PDNC005]|uniref:hypothetical protein n=1 Tax=unclassified Gordonia (in: high G+C Gram-positive bacteria) TaxID=2657482 RepID=UPI0019629614|nr:hypothetical protein [Gordonia sp. PDNC005]QRY62564.1 hypothetical protein JVX90_19725 [Gordonia sp. PDNC005]